MKKKSAEDYLDKLLNSVNDEKMKKEKFKETAKMLEDAMHFWEEGGEDMDFEEASYMQTPVKEEKKSEQEDFLDALLNGAKNTEFGMNKKRVNPNPMYSRRVSKSEADFLKEFEAELADGDDDFSDLFGQFEDAIEPEDRLGSEDIHIEKHEADSFTLGDVDLASLVDEAAGVMAAAPKEAAPAQDATMAEDVPMDDLSLTDILMDSPMQEPEPEEIPMDPVPIDEIPVDVFEDLFGGEDGLNLAEPVPVETASEGIDLGNLGEEDLMNLLAGADGLSDIGDMLSQNESGAEVPVDGLDAFAAFAEGEMAAQEISAEPVEEEIDLGKKGKKAKKVKGDNKGGLLGKLSAIVGSLMSGDDEDEVELKPAKAPTAEALSGENADILAELESLEEKPSKKEKKKKEKKKKEKKPKKEKAPKKPKTPKPKKEKKPKEVDNTPPLPRGPVIMIWVMVASLFALVLLGVNTIGYSSSISNAKSLKNQGHYAEAFAELDGLEIKEKDLELYDQLAILSTADSELNAYEAFSKNENMVIQAYDSLICAAGRCEINEENADVYGCLGQLEIIKKTVSNELEQKYDTTYEEAIEMYSKSKHDRDAYSIDVYEKLRSLGYELD